MPAVQSALADCRAAVERVVAQPGPFTWDNLCQPLAESDDRLSRIWSPIGHLNSVKNSPELRAAYEQALPLLSEYGTWVGQHEGLYQAYRSLKEGAAFEALSVPQRKAVDNALRDFELSGIGLSADKQQRYGEIVARLSELGSTYSNNVLDATMGWSKLITDEAELSGLPESALAQAQAMAQAKEQDGWLLTLDMPSYLPVLTYADNRALREEMYRAFATRASDQGPNAGKWDNSEVMAETLALRHELAQLLGFDTYADKSLATKMAESPEQVIGFLSDLAKRARPQAEQELAQLRAFAKQHYGVDELEAWDITYYGEKQKQHLFSISDEQLRPYFPEQRVVEGLFEVVKRIYGITAKERKDVETWHPDVRFFDLFDANGELRGSFYLDLYARENKRGGAWMDDCVGSLRKADGTLQKPVAYLTCNFNRPLGDQPALFTHNEVTTLFHEFGHGLHHMLTQIDTAGVSGINGGAVGCGRTAEPVYGKLVLGAGSAGVYLGPLPERRAAAEGHARQAAGGQELPGGAVHPAPAGVRPVRFPHALRIQPGKRRADPADAGGSEENGGGGAFAKLGPLPARLQPHLRRRLCGGLLQLPVGGSAVGRRLLALRRRGDFQRRNRQILPRQHPCRAAVRKSRWRCSNASVAASRSWMLCCAITALKDNPTRERVFIV